MKWQDFKLSCANQTELKDFLALRLQYWLYIVVVRSVVVCEAAMTVNSQNALFILCGLAHLVVHYYAEEVRSRPDCPAIFCNDKVGSTSFPFSGYSTGCNGLYDVDCSNRSNPKIQFNGGGYWYQLESITGSSSIFIKDSNLQERLERENCSDEVFDLLSLSVRSSVVNIYITNNLTLFRCNNIQPDNPPYRGPNYACSSRRYTYYTSSQDSLVCSTIHIPIREGFPPNLYDLSALTAEFSLQVQVNEECHRCHDKHGRCMDDGEFVCLDADLEKGMLYGFIAQYLH